MTETTPEPLVETPPGDMSDYPTRLLPRWEMYALFVGDWLMYLIFAVLGESSHGLYQTQPFLRATVNVAAPFMIGWLVASAILGTYRATALFPLGRAIVRNGTAALLGGLLGGVFWGLANRSRLPVWQFFAITTPISAAIILAWRVGWSRLRRLWWPELP